jgi:hypothetical protein
MKIAELIHILKQLQESGLEEVDAMERTDDEPWYYIKGPKYNCSIPHESNKIGRPTVELMTKQPISLLREQPGEDSKV